MGEADITRKTRMKAIADFLQRVLQEPASSSSDHAETEAKKKKKKQPPPSPLPSRHYEDGTQTEVKAIPSTSAAPAVYETPKPSFTIGEISEDNDDDADSDDDDNDFVKGDTRASGWERENIGPIASRYILPHLSNRHRRHLHTRYGIRKTVTRSRWVITQCS